jgi:hypothetical protein
LIFIFLLQCRASTRNWRLSSARSSSAARRSRRSCKWRSRANSSGKHFWKCLEFSCTTRFDCCRQFRFLKFTYSLVCVVQVLCFGLYRSPQRSLGASLPYVYISPPVPFIDHKLIIYSSICLQYYRY